MIDVKPLDDRPCEYCGTMLDEDGREDGFVEAGPITHFTLMCRDRIAAALRATKKALDAERAARAEAEAKLGGRCVAGHRQLWLGDHWEPCRTCGREVRDATEAATAKRIAEYLRDVGVFPGVVAAIERGDWRR